MKYLYEGFYECRLIADVVAFKWDAISEVTFAQPLNDPGNYSLSIGRYLLIPVDFREGGELSGLN